MRMKDTKPIKHKIRPVPYHCRKEFEQIIKDQLAAGIIQPSKAATCSPVNLVLKEDGSLRLTIDYRKINNATEPDPYPLPRIDDIIARLAKNKVFSIIDLANGYYQVKMHPESIKYTTFISEFGKFEYLAMPMGLKNAGSTFQRMMDKVLEGLVGEICFVYLDDIIIFSEDVESHEGRVKQVLDRLKTNCLQIKLKKCEFIRPTIRFLGHIISYGKVEKSQHLVEAIAQAELPKTMRQLRGFIGLANYYRKFIKNFAKIAAPLNKHLNATDKSVLMDYEAIKAFETLKRELTDMDNILSLPNFDLNFILETDAIGAALMQKIDGKECPIALYSRAMTVAEKNYDTSQKELLAIVKSVEHFKQFLYGKVFILKTDHQPLIAIKTKAKPSTRLGRWLNDLADYSFKTEHKKGTDSILADALSRLNLPAFEEEEPTRVEKIINWMGLQYESDIT